jgi:hypothetical protein
MEQRLPAEGMEALLPRGVNFSVVKDLPREMTGKFTRAGDGECNVEFNVEFDGEFIMEVSIA